MPKQMNSVSKGPVKGCLRLAQEFRLKASYFEGYVERLLIGIDTPVSLKVYMLFKYKEFDQLAELSINPMDYGDCPFLWARLQHPIYSGAYFQSDFAAISLLRKNENLKTSFDRKGNALETFVLNEKVCNETNKRIGSYLLGKQTCPNEYVLNACIRKIDSILGSFSVDRLLDDCRWGPGSTYKCTGLDTSAVEKFFTENQISEEAYRLYVPVLREAYPHWRKLQSDLEITGFSRIDTVPKNCKTDRTIGIEPGINSWIQTGLGRQIRTRLKRVGFDLNSNLRNQEGALKGSLDGTLATVDFSSASDTISKSVVELLLPPLWFTCLNSARAHFYTFDGVTATPFHKFSSMGNGFTFELESLIFVSLALSVCEYLGLDTGFVSVFGDDIVMPVEGVEMYAEICNFLGFTVNKAKTYKSSCFRESCGSYFFNGLDVKPLFLKKTPIFIRDVYNLLNKTRLLAHLFNKRDGCAVRLRSAWSYILSSVPTRIRYFGPEISGNATIHETIERCARSSPDGWEGFLFTGLVEQAAKHQAWHHGVLLARLQSPSREMAYNNTISLRRKVKLVLCKDMFTHLWYAFGEWH